MFCAIVATVNVNTSEKKQGVWNGKLVSMEDAVEFGERGRVKCARGADKQTNQVTTNTE